MVLRKILALVLCVLLLAGCAGTDAEINRAMALREKLLTGNGCQFDAVVTADFGDKTYCFTMACQGDKNGNLQFSVTQPESISGITGTIGERGGKLTFDNTALGFSLLADGEVSPVSAPWLLLKTLRGGYLKTTSTEGDLCHVTIDDSYEQDALQLDIWLNSENVPVSCEILWQGRRILSIQVQSFIFL